MTPETQIDPPTSQLTKITPAIDLKIQLPGPFPGDADFPGPGGGLGCVFLTNSQEIGETWPHFQGGL